MNIAKKTLVLSLAAVLAGCAAYPTQYGGVAYGFDPGRVAGAGTGAAVGAAIGGAVGGWEGAGVGALLGGGVGALASPSYGSAYSYPSYGYGYNYQPYDYGYNGGYPQQPYYQEPAQKPCQVYWSGTWRDGQWVRTGQYNCQQSIDTPPPAPPMPPPQ